ncbi:MAG: hypothetical protein ACXAE3_16450, partial [Candidatus Kariarchaeaceae archaeon]
MDRTSALILFLLILPVFMVGGVYAIGPETPVSYIEPDQITEEPINPSNPTNVVIRESAIYDAPVGDQDPIAHFTGVIFWEELAGSPLGFFVNTSLVINSEFRDFETKNPMQIQESCTGAFGFVTNCVEDRGDSYRIVPEGRSFQYEIESYYEPDVIEDTGFIVVFNSQSVDFSIDIDGEPAFARTDYSNIIILPQGAGIVSYAPIDDGFLAP